MAAKIRAGVPALRSATDAEILAADFPLTRALADRHRSGIDRRRVIDIGDAGSGTRAIDLTSLAWYTFHDPLLDGGRRLLWARILDLVGQAGATVLAASHILHMLEIPIRHGRHTVVSGLVNRGHQALDELNA